MNEDDTMPTGEDEDDRPASTQDEAEFLRHVKAWFLKDREHSSEWRKLAKEDFDFVAGKQWSEEDEQKLKDEMRPVITFNRIQPTIEAVVGLEIGNRREVKYLPREMGDVQKNEILTSAAEWARDECDAEDEETDAFFNTVVCGMGWTDTRIDYEEDEEGKIIVECLDPIEMYWDASARKRNLTDARRFYRVRSMPLADAQEMFPDAEKSDLDAAWARGEEKGEQPGNADPEASYQDEEKKDADAEVTIVHMQWWEREPYHRVAMGGETQEVSTEDFPELKKRADQMAKMDPMAQPMRHVKLYRRKYMQAFIGAKVLERGPSPCDKHFSWECITGKRDHNKGTFYGLVRGMIDPQRWANKWLSQSLHILNTNAKGGIVAEEGITDDWREFEMGWARNDKITKVKNGAIQNNRFKEKVAAAFPAGFENLLQFAISSIRDTSGVNLELLGLADRQQAGVLEDQRKQAGMTILATLFDSLRRYRKRQGRVLLYYITEYLSDGRLIRVVGKESEQYVPLIHEPGSVKFDIIVDDQATSPNQKQRVWQMFQQLAPIVGPIMGPEEWLIMLEFSEFPTSVVEKLKANLQKKQQEQAPKQQEAEQIGKAQMAAEIEKTQSEAAENAAETEKVRVETMLLPIEAEADMQAQMIKAAQPPAQRTFPN